MCEGWSTEYHVYQRLLGVLVETGPELNPIIKARLRNLVATLRVVMFPNLTSSEQQSLLDLAHATAFNMSSLQFEIIPEVIRDDPDHSRSWIVRTLRFQNHNNKSAIKTA